MKDGPRERKNETGQYTEMPLLATRQEIQEQALQVLLNMVRGGSMNVTFMLSQSIRPSVNLVAVATIPFLLPIGRRTFHTLLVSGEISTSVFTRNGRTAAKASNGPARLTLGPRN